MDWRNNFHVIKLLKKITFSIFNTQPHIHYDNDYFYDVDVSVQIG